MTHGAVIAREYGLPAVVGIEGATKRIARWPADPRERHRRLRGVAERVRPTAPDPSTRRNAKLSLMAEQHDPDPLPPRQPASAPRLPRRLTRGEDVIDPAAWAGAIPAATGIVPRIRIGKRRWVSVLWLAPIGLVGLIVAIAIAQELRNHPRRRAVHRRSPRRHACLPLRSPDAGVVALAALPQPVLPALHHPRPASRSSPTTRGSTGRGTRTPGKEWFRDPEAGAADPLWTAKQDSITLPRQVGLPGLRHSIGLARWWHLGIDVLWLANGAGLLRPAIRHRRSGDGWCRRAGTSSRMPLSVLIQYLSLDWPTETGWVAYNGLQLLAYFVTVFVAAPLALITGLGMSPALSTRFQRISTVLSIQMARSLHFLVMCWFVLFIIMHVSLVFTTGLLHNLNHIYAGRDDDTGSGSGCSPSSMVVVVVGVGRGDAVHPAPPAGRAARRVRARSGRRSACSSMWTPSPASTARKTSRRTSGTTARTPTPTSTGRCSTSGFVDYRLRINGLVANPVELDLARAARAAAPRADHAALLHPGLVGRRQVGRRLDGDDHGPGPAATRRRSGSSSTRSATAPTRASTTTPTRSSR